MERSTQYPMASEEEIHTRNRRGLKRLKRPKPPVEVDSGKPPVSSKPAKPIVPPLPPVPPVLPKPITKLKGTQASLGDSQKIVGLNKNNAFPPLPKQVAASARSAFVNAAVGGLINIPFTVGEHFASKTIIARIEAQAKMPGAEQVSANGVKTTVDPGATEQQKIEARLESHEIKLELMVNSILSINEGPDAPAVGKGPGAPTDTGGRLVNLEKTMDVVEAQMKDIATRYGLIYEPYVAPASSETPTEQSRLEVIEQRLIHMTRMLKRLVKVAEADAE
ncbi:hypothetical protein [Pseudomonas palleroniana]|nr:hypothetical protein [Pseudomonas palleroniana]